MTKERLEKINPTVNKDPSTPTKYIPWNIGAINIGGTIFERSVRRSELHLAPKKIISAVLWRILVGDARSCWTAGLLISALP